MMMSLVLDTKLELDERGIPHALPQEAYSHSPAGMIPPGGEVDAELRELPATS